MKRDVRQRRSLIQRSLVLRTGDIGRRVISGAGYQVTGIVLRTTITVASTAALARLLMPADFGYIAMATVVTEFAALFGAFGFTNVLIQRRVITRLQLDTVFWASLGIGSVLTLAVFLASFLTSWLFADPQVGPLLRVLCLSFVLNSFSAVPWTVMSRLMRFRTEFWINITNVVVRTSATVSCAWFGFGVWSLVVGALVGSVVGGVLSFVFVPYLPRFRFYLPLLMGTWRTSGGYLGNTLLYYASSNIDLLLIGRQLGAAPLGYYQNARSLTDEIRARIAMPIQHVLFPALSALQNERERIQQLVLRAGRLLAAVVVPVGLGVSVNATELVLVLYGEMWRPMIPVMAFFGLSAALRAATAIASPLFNANDRVGLALRYNAIGAALLIGGVLLAMPYGLEMVAAAVAVVSLYSLVSFRAAFGLIGLGLRDMTQVLAPPLLSGVVMGLFTVASRQLAWSHEPAVLLPVHVVVGAFVYLSTLHLISGRYMQDVRQISAMVFKRRGGDVT